MKFNKLQHQALIYMSGVHPDTAKGRAEKDDDLSAEIKETIHAFVDRESLAHYGISAYEVAPESFSSEPDLEGAIIEALDESIRYVDGWTSPAEMSAAVEAVLDWIEYGQSEH